MVQQKTSRLYRYCPQCDYITKNASTMSMHIAMKHIMKPKHECLECFKKFPTKTQMEHHYINHHCEADISCKNLKCTKVFKNTTSQKIHYTRKHMKNDKLFVKTQTNGIVKCATCPYEATKSAMYYHVANCSPYSPFSEKFMNGGGNFCSPCEDPILENLRNTELLENNFFSALPPPGPETSLETYYCENKMLEEDLEEDLKMLLDVDDDFFIPSYFDDVNE